MRQVGTIKELWRYPVSSVTGELLQEAPVSPAGMTGDRRYAMVDAQTGVVAHPERDKRWQRAVFVRSRTAENGAAELLVPDHDWLAVDDPGAGEVLSRFFEFDVAVRPYERTASAGHAAELAVDRYDVSPLHLLTSASVDHLKSIYLAGNPDPRRFRPNIFMTAGADVEGFAELGWIDAAIRLGDVEGTVIAPTKRCGFTIIAQDGLDNDPEILRNIMKFGNRNMGVYCAPSAAGILRVGDRVLL